MFNSACGFTLMEMLISLFLGSLLFVGLIEVNNLLTANIMLQNGLFRIQDEGRYAVMLLEAKIREAGFSNCSKNNLSNSSDVLTVYSSSKVASFWNIKPRFNSDVLVLGSCEPYQGHKQFVKTAYFVGDTSRKNRNGQPITALYEKHYGGNKQELVEGVENLKIQAGLGTGNFRDILRYQYADENVHWELVKSLKFFLVINSVESAITYHQGANDRRLHKPWYGYATIRERS